MVIRQKQLFIILELISILFIVGTGILIQYSSSKVQEYESRIQMALAVSSFNMVEMNSWQNERIATDISKVGVLLGGKYNPPSDSYLSTLPKEVQDVWIKYKGGEISAQVLLSNLSEFADRRAKGFQETFNENNVPQLNRTVAYKPKFLGVFEIDVEYYKEIILYAYIIQLLAVAFSAYLYWRLLKLK